MKKSILLFAFIGLVSCKNDDNISFKKGDISGNWKMVKYLGFTAELPNISKGDVIWNANANNITMTNNSAYPYVSASGNYHYGWFNGETIVINYSPSVFTYYKVKVTSQTLSLTEVSKPAGPEITEPVSLEFEK